MNKNFFGLIYGIGGAFLVAMFIYNESRGVVYFSTDSKRPFPNVAKSSRGYRSPGFWYTGYHGGK
jgi:hypothetical protein